MKVEIWSDVMCPFCYIGKRRFEIAMEQFSGNNEVQVEWKSYQLNPQLITQPDKNHDEYLAEQKGISLEQARRMSSHAINMARQTGINLNFEKAIPANTFKAHQLIHFAKQSGKQNLAKEVLFRSHFTDGLNIDDTIVLIELGREIGLNSDDVKDLYKNERFADDVQTDIYEAQQVGVKGVPFFLFNSKYVVSGAQDSTVFLSALEQIKAKEDEK